MFSARRLPPLLLAICVTPACGRSLRDPDTTSETQLRAAALSGNAAGAQTNATEQSPEAERGAHPQATGAQRRSAFSEAAYAAHLEQLRPRIPPGFHLLVEPPFVVIGDGGQDAVRARAAGVVRWAVTQLEQDFFKQPPQRILDIWLFDGEQSYETHTTALFGEAPTTPYGFYSSEHGALVMNIQTGGGTLVHEIVHPYMEANFPECPAWFNEGLGSLFEQSAERDGHIVGLTNWRLAGLQDAIRQGRVGSLEALLSSSEAEFYADETGLNYAMARYLLHYLQDRGELRSYFRRFVAARPNDPTGIETLTSLLHEPELKGFQKRWHDYVLALRFPEPDE